MLQLQNLGKMQTQVAAQGYMTLHEPAIRCKFRMHIPQLLGLAPALRQHQSMLGAQGQCHKLPEQRPDGCCDAALR